MVRDEQRGASPGAGVSGSTGVRAFDFDELVRREPRLAALEERVRAVRDTGEGSFFCSNHVWLPLASELRQLVGVYRRGWSAHEPGDPLYDTYAFEACYLRLSRVMPPCRGCGCLLFQPWRDRQLAELQGAVGRGEAPPGSP